MNDADLPSGSDTASSEALIAVQRRRFHAELLKDTLSIDSQGVPSNADRHNVPSKRVALKIAERLLAETISERVAGQTKGTAFEVHCAEFVASTFQALSSLRPGRWEIYQVTGRDPLVLAKFEQYAHLVALHDATQRDPQLAAALGSDYVIRPDIVIARWPEPDEVINKEGVLVDHTVSTRSPLREAVNDMPLLHASLSCKWTIRSDRSQNSRSEALNLIRNRKGSLPHVAVVTAEPLPSRIASIALGTGDIDCVYHFALYELQDALASEGLADAVDLLSIMVDGKRLKDISDLPLDLAT